MIGDDLQGHARAIAASVATGLTIPTVWLSTLDLVLRIILTVVGIATGVYGLLYWRLTYKQKKDAKN